MVGAESEVSRAVADVFALAASFVVRHRPQGCAEGRELKIRPILELVVVVPVAPEVRVQNAHPTRRGGRW
jgi:hypothetical protein